MRFLSPLRALAAAALLSGGFSTSWAVPIAWDGGASPNNNWYDAVNWAGDVVPGAADDVTIDVSVMVTVSVTSPAINFQSLVLGGVSNSTLTISTGIVGGYLEIRNNATLIQDTLVELQLTSVTVLSGGLIDHINGGAAKVNIVTTGDFTLTGGASIDVDGDGFNGGGAGSPTGAAGSGTRPGAGGAADDQGGGGGGHGGAGGAGGNGDAGGLTDDSVVAPILHGSGGGGGGDPTVLGNGGRGGGLVQLIVGGTMDLSGIITADGNPGTGSGRGAGGGGAGGAIYIQTVNMAGGGSVSVDGGNGGVGGNSAGGGGGAGRVAIVFTGTNVATITYTANGGALGAGPGPAIAGGLGTAFNQPTSVNDLSVSVRISTGLGASSQTVRLQWTSPKVGIAGASNNWDIRMATFPISSQALYDSLAVTNVISTSVIEGLVVSTDIPPLDPLVTWYFAMTTSDQQSLRSTLSNAATVQAYIIAVPASGANSYGVAWGDIDRDGDLDAIVSNGNGQSEVLLTNDGTGTLTSLGLGNGGDDRGGIALGDFDNDGDLDAIVANLGNEQLLTNNGGTFSVSTIGSGLSSRGVAWGDVDGDGDLDVLIANSGASDEVLLRNLGSGTFAVETLAGTGGDSYGVAWGDYDNDGDLDAIVANSSGQDEYLLRNDGGNLTQVPIAGTGGDSQSIAWSDFDGDGDLDVLVVNSGTDDEFLLRNDGGGTFVPVPLTGTAGSSLGGAWGDYDGDGDPDAVVANSGSEDGYLLRNDGGTLVQVTLQGTGGNSRGVSWGDYDNDGDLDLIFSNDGGQDEFVLRNDAVTVHTAPVPPTSGFSASFSEYGVEASSGVLTLRWDAGSDAETSDADFLNYFVRLGTTVAGSSTTYKIPARYSLDGNSGGGSFLYSTRLGGSQRGMKVVMQKETTTYWAVMTVDAEFDRSAESGEQTTTVVAPAGITDLQVLALVSTGFAASSHTVLLTWTAPGDDGALFAITGGTFNVRWDTNPITSMSEFAAAPNSILITTSVSPGVVASTDIPNLDPLVTWYFAITTQDSIGVRSDLSNPATALSTVRIFKQADREDAITWGDMDGDGDLDFVAACTTCDERLYTNDGTGNFTQSVIDSGTDGRGVALADYDVDGDLDALIARWGADDTILRNDGAGVFFSTAITDSGTKQTFAVAWGDYDNDGDLDFVGTKDAGDDAYLATNIGGGSFSTASLVGVAGQCLAAAWGDYDNDGDLDLAIGCSSTVDYLLTNVSGSTFSYSLLSAGGVFVTGALAWVDVDADGDLDLAVSATGNNYYLRNDAGVFSAKIPIINTTGNGTGLVVGDFDDDGDMDFVISNQAAVAAVFAENDGAGNFTAVDIPATASGGGDALSISAGDMDGDGDLDLVIGRRDTGEDIFINNEVATTHSNPLPPAAFSASFSEYSVGSTSGVLSLEWSNGSDSETTDPDLLEYFVRVGTTVAGSSTTLKFPPLFSRDGSSGGGFLYSTRLTPAQRGINLVFQKETTAFWAVETEDATLARSASSGEQTTILAAPSPVTDLSAVTVSTGFAASSTTVRLTWTAPGDDGEQFAIVGGTFDVRWGTTPILDFADYSAAPFQMLITTSVSPGVLASTAIANLDPSVTWYFAVTTQDSIGVRSFLSNPTTAEAIVRIFRTSDRSNGVAWGDFDRDGDLDYMVSNNDADKRLYTNDGAGNFVESVMDTTGEGRGVALADYDIDGDLDVLVGRYGAADNILRNDGGSFTPVSAQTEVATQTLVVAWGDYDNDGDLDFAAATDVGQDAYLATNDGDGTFSTTTLSGVVGSCSAIAWGDYNEDGFLDLAIGCTSNTDYLLTGVDGSTFTYSILTAGGVVDTHGLAWVDVEGDGDLDLAVAAQGNSYYLRNDAGSFSVKVNLPGATGGGRGIAVGDFDDDNDMDLAISNDSSQPIEIAYNDGTGTYEVLDIARTSSVGTGRGISAGDMDGDGDLDLVFVRWDGGDDILIRNDVGGSHTPPAAPTGLSTLFTPYSSFATSGTLAMQWNNASDAETTDVDLLEYLVRVGTTVAGSSTTLKFPPLYSNDGYGGHGFLYSTRLTPSQRGIKLVMQTETTVYWSVLTIDASGARSGSSSENSIDLSAPAVITDLDVSQNTTIETSSISFITLAFAAPGENGSVGNLGSAARYDVRWSTGGPIDTQAKYIDATNAFQFSAQGTAGAAVTLQVGVEAGQQHYFAITTIDSPGVRSGISNSPSQIVDGMRQEITDTANFAVLQTATTGFLKLELWTETGLVRWNKLRVIKDGLLPDVAVSDVGVFRDANLNGIFDAGDAGAKITAAAVFVSSAVEMTLTSVQTINSSTQTYFVGLTMNSSFLPVADTTVAIRLDGQAFSVSSGGVLGIDFPALIFDGIDDKFLAPFDVSMDVGAAGQVTLEAWIRTVDQGTDRSILTRANVSADTGYRLWLNGGGCGAGVPTFYVGSSFLCANDGVVNVSVADGLWHHVAATFITGTGGVIFIDGIELAPGALGGSLFDSSNNLGIGGPNETGGSYFTGEIDEVRVSNFARYPGELPPVRRNNAAGAVMLYHFDTVSIGTNTFDDASVGNNDVTLHGQAVGYARSTGTHINDVSDVVFATSTDISPPLFFRNSFNVGVMRLDLWTGGDRATLAAVSVEKTGTGLESGVTNLQFFLDDGDGVFDSGLDQSLVSGINFFTGKATFTFSIANQQLLSPTTKVYFIAWDILGSASADLTLGLQLGTTEEFSLVGSTDIVSTDDFPLLTTPVIVATAEVLVTVESATATWVNTSSIVFQGVFGSGNVDHYHYVFDQSPATIVTGPNPLWSTGKTTVTATVGANNWFFHVRAFDTSDTAGLQEDIGPYFVDTAVPSGGSYQHFNAAQTAIGESVFNDLADPVTAQINVFDVLAGLNIDGLAPLAPASGTVSLWHFDDVSGTWADAGDAQNILSVGGGIPDRIAGRFAGGIQTNTGSFLSNTSPAGLPVGNADRAIEAWVLPRSTQGVGGIISYGSGAGVLALQLNAGVFEVDLGGTTASAGPVLSTGVWQHVAFVFDGVTNTGSFYVDGAPVGTNVYGAQTTTAGTLQVGRSAAGDFDGSIDDLRISRRVISQAEIGSDFIYGNPYWVSYSTDTGVTWRVVTATEAGSGAYVTLTGVHGTTASQVLKVVGLDLIVSEVTSVGASATNQIRFHPSDLPGNTSILGPFGILIDTNAGVAFSTPSIPSNGDYADLGTDFYWTGPSTPLVQGLGGSFYLEVSSGDASFAPANIDINIAVAATVNDPIAQKVTGVYNSTFTLSEGTTYYWRVRSRSSLDIFGSYGPVHSFVTDVTSPTESGFRVFNSTAGSFGQGEYIDLLTGVTVQLTVQDGISGLSHNHAAPIPANAIALWRFSELSGINPSDDSGNGNTGTLNCATPGSCSIATLSGTPRGAGLHCESGRGMTAPNANFNFPAASNFSVSAWINPTAVTGNNVIAAVGAATDVTNTNWVFLINNGSLNLRNNTGGGPLGPGSSVIAGEWQHVAVSVQGSNVRFYINGTLNFIGSWSGNSGGGSMLFSVCSGIQDSGIWESGFAGDIDDLVIYNAPVTAEEIANHYGATKPGSFSIEYSTTVGQIWNVVSATAAVGGNAWVEITGVDGDTAAQTFTVRDLTLTHSTGTVTGAGGTNQIRFIVPDRGDRFITAGPYSVIIDTLAAAAVSTPTFPVSGAYVRRTPNFLWAGPSTPTAVGMGPSAFYLLEVDEDSDFGSPEIVISTPVIIGSTSSIGTAGTYLSTQTLSDNTTYYWRVRPQDFLGLLSPGLTLNSFVTDFSTPVLQSFVSINSTGGAAVEAIGIDLISGVTVQVAVQDAGPAGLAILPIDGVTPFGILVTTNGASFPNEEWRDGDFRRSFGQGGVTDAFEVVQFQGKLYAGASGSQVFEYDGTSWILSQDLAGTGVVAFQEFNGELFVGQTGSGEIWKFDGSWSLFFDHGGGETQALGVHGGKLYAGTDGLIWVYDPAAAGSGWRISFDPVDTSILSMAAYGGELFAGGNPNLYKFDGSSWTITEIVSANVNDLAEFDGRLFAATNNSGIIRVFDGSSWATSYDPVSENIVAGFGRFAGRLYAGIYTGGAVSRIIAYDGRDWMRIRTMNPSDIIRDFAEFNGKLYSAALINPAEGIVFVTTPTAVSIAGADGSTGVEVLVSTGIMLVPSVSNVICNGISGCLADNQVRFTYADKTGEGAAAGPFAVLVDPLLSAPTSFAPFSGDFIRDNFAELSWVETSTQIIHDIEIDRDADFALPVDLTVTATTFHNSSSLPTLLQATTYYWRVRAGNTFGVRSEFSETRSFVVDSVAPLLAPQPYTTENSTGGIFLESEYINLSQGATVTLSLQDTNSGLGFLGFDSLDRVGVWSFEDVVGATVTDRSGNGNFAILTSTDMRFTRGKIGRGIISPTGVGHVLVTTPTVAAWDGVTVAGWVRPLANNISFKNLWASRQFRLYARSQDGLVELNYGPAAGQNGGCSFSTGLSFPLGAWMHVAVIMHPTENAIFVDGVKAGSCNSGPSGGTAEDTSYSFGADVLSGLGGLGEFEGYLDEIRIYSRRLTVAELKRESLERIMSVEVSTDAGQNWSVVSSTFGTGARIAFSGVDGVVGFETIAAGNLTLTESTNTSICAQVEPCGATNQVRFFGPDRAGNILRTGVFAVLVDTSVPLPIITSLTPLTTESMHVTSTGTDNLSGVGGFNFEASTSPGFAFPISSSGFLSQSTFTFTGLVSASTYYVRVIVRDLVLNVSTPSVSFATSTFGTVFFSTIPAAPPNAGQAAEVAMMGFTLNTKAGVTSAFEGMTIRRLGLSDDSDVSEVRIYRDDGDAIFSAASDIDISPGSIIFVSSQAVLTLPASEPVTVLKSTYFVVYQIATDATVGATIGIEISSASAVNLNFPSSAEGIFPSPEVLPFLDIIDGANLITFTPLPFAPLVTEVQPGTADNPILKLRAQTDTGTSLISSMVFRLNGTLPSNRIPRINVWRDADPIDGLFDALVDEKLTTGTDVFEPLEKISTVTFSLIVSPVSSRTVTTTSRLFFVTADIGGGASVGDNFSISIDTESLVTLGNQADIVGFSVVGPVVSTTMTIVLNNILSVNPVDTVPAAFTQGQTYTVLRASFVVDAAETTIDRIQVGRIGTGVDTDISNVELFLDASALPEPEGDTLLASGTFSSSFLSLPIATQTITVSTASIYVRYTISGGANPGNTLGAQLGASAVRITNPNTTLNAAFPFNTANAPVTAIVNELLVTVVNDETVGSPTQGVSDYPMLRLDIASTAGDFLWQNLVIDKLGTASSTDVAKVNLFRDFDGNQLFDVLIDSRVTSDAQTFDAGGSVNLSLTPAQTVTLATQTFFVTLSLDPNAGPGPTVGLSVPTTAAFSLFAPNTTNPNIQSFPLNSSTPQINAFANTISVSTTGAVPSGGAEIGEVNVGVMKLVLNTDISAANWQSITLNQSGSAQSSDIDAVEVYFDFNNFGIWDPANVANYQLVSSSVTQSFDGGGNVTLTFPTPPVVTATPGTFFVVVDVSSNAIPGRDIVVRVSAGANYSFNSPNLADPGATFTSPSLPLKAPPISMFLQGSSSAPATGIQGQAGIVMETLLAWTDAHSAKFTGVTLTKTGTGVDSDIKLVKFYKDRVKDGLFNSIDDSPPLASGNFVSGSLQLAFAQELVTATTDTFYIVYDIDGIATAGVTHGVSIVASGDIDIDTPPNSVDIAAFPIVSSTLGVAATSTRLEVQIGQLAPGTLNQAATHQILLSLTLNTTGSALAWNTLTIQSSGTATDADILAVNIWADSIFAGIQGQVDVGIDTRVTSGLNSFVGGNAVLSLGSEPVGLGAQQYLLTVDVAPFADPGKTISVVLLSSAAFGVSSPNFVDDLAPVYPIGSDPNTSIKKVPEQIGFTAIDIGPTGFNQGSELAFVRLDAYSTRYRAEWTGLTVSKFGSLSDLDVSDVNFYKDTDLSGTFTAGDLFIGSGTFVGGQANQSNVVFSSFQTISPATATYFVTLRIPASAVIGSQVQLTFDKAEFDSHITGLDTALQDTLPFTNAQPAVILDATTPTKPTVVVDGPFSSNFQFLHFVWTSTVASGQISGASFAIGTTAGGNDIIDWTALTAAQTDVNATGGIPLAHATTYFVSVTVAANGQTSPIGISAPILMDFQTPPPPTAPAVTPGDTSLLITWVPVASGPSGILGYLVDFRTERVPLWINAKTGATSGTQALGVQSSGPLGAVFTVAVSSSEVATGNSLQANNVPQGTVFVRVRSVSGSGIASDSSQVIKVQLGPLPSDGIRGASNYPNPFDSRATTTKIFYELAQNSEVTITIYSVFGRELNKLTFGSGTTGGSAGANTVEWDGADTAGSKVSKGIYLAVIEAGGAREILKIGVIH